MTITIGIDPHKATHTAVAIDTKGSFGGRPSTSSAVQPRGLRSMSFDRRAIDSASPTNQGR